MVSSLLIVFSSKGAGRLDQNLNTKQWMSSSVSVKPLAGLQKINISTEGMGE